MAAGSLSAGEDHTGVEFGCHRSTGSGFKSHHGAAEVFGKESLDFFHITGSGGGFAGDRLGGCTVAQGFRQFWGVGGTGFLQSRNSSTHFFVLSVKIF